MKKILVYLSPNKKFDEISDKLLSIQIENSIDFGWKPENIILLTNFQFEKEVLKAFVIDDRYFSNHSPISTKLSALIGAFDNNLIGNGLYWIHDLDAFQEHKITEKDINLSRWDMGLCVFGRLMKWSGGSIFFKKEAEDIFKITNELMLKKKLIDEEALTQVTHYYEDIHNRVKKLNISYNIVPFNIKTCYSQALKPLRVIHFNPFEGIRQLRVPSALEFYKGQNEINTSLISNRLLEIFKRNGI